MKRTLSLFLVVLLLTGSVFAGGKAETAKAEGPVELTFWHAMGGVNGEAIAHMVDQFNKEYEGKIHVTYEFQGTYDDEFAKI